MTPRKAGPEYQKGSQVAVFERDEETGEAIRYVEVDADNNAWLCEKGEEPKYRADGLAGIERDEYADGKSKK